MKPNHSSDNLKEKVDLYNFLEDRLLQYVGSGESLFGEEIHDFFARMEKDLLQLFQDYAMGCVPKERGEKKGNRLYIDEIGLGYNQARQTMLDKLEDKS